jgi:hypothetical protein
VLDFEGNLYDDNLLVFFLSRLRQQAQFKDASQLALQIGADVGRAQVAFKRSFEASTDDYFRFMAEYAKIMALSNAEPWK